jgi:hypothetical protein
VSDRLKELQRQRALAQEQLAWLDREIAAESGKAGASAAIKTAADKPVAPSTQTNPPPVAPVSASPHPGSDAAAATAAAEAIIEKYQNKASSVQSEVKRGCFIYFFLALVLVGLGVLALYLYSVHKR